MSEPFHFYTQAHLVRLLGMKAKNPVELLEGIRTVPVSSIYYHTHRFLQQHHYLSPEPPNDFAYWLTSILGMQEWGEAVASVDVIQYRDLEHLRSRLEAVLSGYLAKGGYLAQAPEGHEFHFVSCVTVITPTPYIAHDAAQFLEALRRVSINSIYFHVFEARLRLKNNGNDFTLWFQGLGKEKLAAELSRLDPYTITLEGLRKKIIKLVSRYA